MPIGLLTPIAEQLHVDAQSVGLLIGAYAGGVAVGSIPLSALVARFDGRTTLLALLGVLTRAAASSPAAQPCPSP